jgi:hypothetical protein
MSQEPKKKQDDNKTSAPEGDKYYFGGIKEFKLEEIEAEILNDNVYLDVFAGSDVRFKEDVQSFNGALELISNLGVYKYQYKTSEFIEQNFPEGKQIGVMAQDLEKIMPELVRQDEQGYRFVNYAGLSPVLLSGIQELVSITKQQAETIEQLQTIVKSLEKKISSN